MTALDPDATEYRQWKETTMVCQVLLALAEAIGIDQGRLFDDLRTRANAPDIRAQIEENRERRAAEKNAAMKTLGSTPRRNYEPERGHDGTSWGRAQELEKLRGSQAARHAEMARAGGLVGDGSDAHMNTRPIREAIYSTLPPED